jgi:thiol-disulfide isomerase/thioredoxin
LTPAQASPSAPRRAWLLPTLLVASVGAALAYRSLHATPTRDPLHGNSEEAPAAMTAALAVKPESERLPFLLKAVQDPSAGTRYAAVDALAKYPVAPAIDAVEAAIHDLDSETRKRALEVLPDMDPNRGLHLLLSALRDDDPWIREAAVTQINSRLSTKSSNHTSVVDKRAVPMLIAALDDPDIDVSFSAMVSLTKLVGKPWRASRLAPPAQHQAVVAQWKGWWAGARSTWPGGTALADVPPSPPTRTDPCPPYHLDRLDGKAVSPESQQGRITLLNFWNTQCGPCIAETPDFIEVDRRYRARNVDVIGVEVGEQDTAKFQKWCSAHGATYPEAVSNPQAVHGFGDIEDLPVTVLIDGHGRIRDIWQGGPRGPEVYAAAIDHLLQAGG